MGADLARLAVVFALYVAVSSVVEWDPLALAFLLTVVPVTAAVLLLFRSRRALRRKRALVRKDGRKHHGQNGQSR